ncbi:adenine phosphoribosyltransferase-like [Saccoglossus kowalevskii]|uniref:adenine phosphoribosyltransferase n=1 Tax=Saccoglossus kowalevskii TaxID=10224 RepID=A0ABM0GNX6_SACKO|nr:PREDICTED: adenine phosphoribosyltransferase-like [Saccoglossus kowalevskii]
MSEKREKHWYLSLMAPNVKGQGYSWIDPSRMYVNTEAFQECVRDLVAAFDPDEIDLVAGIDPFGTTLASAIAFHLKKGYLSVRQKGVFCVETVSAGYKDWKGSELTVEIRKDAFAEGTRVLVVDQWIESGGTMYATIDIIEKLKGIVAGIAVICIEDTENSKALKEKYKCSHLIPPQLQKQFNKHQLDSFKLFEEGRSGLAYQAKHEDRDEQRLC